MLQILIVVVCVVISCFLIKKEAPAFVSVIVLITGVFISIYMLRIFSVITGYINVLINNIDIENLHKYATAIKSNIYVDSFRETILQIVDDVIQEKREIYDDNNNYSSGKKFVE